MSHTRKRDDEHGQIIVIAALVFVVILAFAAIVIDLGRLRNDRQQLVNTLDAAALAGGVYLPIDGSVAANVTKLNSIVTTTIQANYPGLPVSGYTVTYRCLVGVDPSTNLAWVSRDVPGACNPAHAVGHAPTAADFIGAGPTRNSPCSPSAGDKCNVIQIDGSTTTPFSFGRVVGVNSGSSGAVQSVACGGACGSSSVVPVDLAIIVDRTGSMSSTDLKNVETATQSVLQVYNPGLQRVAFGLLGPSDTKKTCSAPNAAAFVTDAASKDYDTTTLAKWFPVGLTGTDSTLPAPVNKQAYDGLATHTGSSILDQGINCFILHTSGTGTNLSTPIQMAITELSTYGRPGVIRGILLLTDGSPNYSGDGTIADFTCNAANVAATAAKAANIKIFTVGFGVGSGDTCPDGTGSGKDKYPSSTYNGKTVTNLLADMATTSIDNSNNCTNPIENTDGDYFFCQPKTSDLISVFQQAATTLSHGTSHLIQLCPSPVVMSTTPTTWAINGSVKITGSNLTGATSVTLGGVAAKSFAISSDTVITAVAAAAGSGSGSVTTPCGGS